MSSSLEPEGSDESGLSGFERSLGSLKPASRVQRDRILFLAGQRQAKSLKRPHWSARNLWPAIAASLAVVSIGQGVLLARRPTPEVRTVYVRMPPESAPSSERPEPASMPQIASRSAVAFDPRAIPAVDRRLPLTFFDEPGRTPNSPVIALVPAEKPLTAAEGLKIRRSEPFDLGDSL
ncbi:hypothetical protein GC170_16355 [bacterium]|nr:hypothetical protein [bacterium]